MRKMKESIQKYYQKANDRLRIEKFLRIVNKSSTWKIPGVYRYSGHYLALRGAFFRKACCQRTQTPQRYQAKSPRMKLNWLNMKLKSSWVGWDVDTTVSQPSTSMVKSTPTASLETHLNESTFPGLYAAHQFSRDSFLFFFSQQLL